MVARGRASRSEVAGSWKSGTRDQDANNRNDPREILHFVDSVQDGGFVESGETESTVGDQGTNGALRFGAQRERKADPTIA